MDAKKNRGKLSQGFVPPAALAYLDVWIFNCSALNSLPPSPSLSHIYIPLALCINCKHLYLLYEILLSIHLILTQVIDRSTDCQSSSAEDRLTTFLPALQTSTTNIHLPGSIRLRLLELYTSPEINSDISQTLAG